MGKWHGVSISLVKKYINTLSEGGLRVLLEMTASSEGIDPRVEENEVKESEINEEFKGENLS